jgi:hypothetical protein
MDTSTVDKARNTSLSIQEILLYSKAVIMIFFAVIGLIGNGISLVTIKRTPKLRTKTYALLASLTLSDFLTGLFVFWVTTYQMIAYVFSANPCSYIMLVAILTCPQKIPSGATIMHVSLISVERFIAVVHPLHYETWVTDTTIKGMIAFGWVFPICLSLFYLTYISRIDWENVYNQGITSAVCNNGHMLHFGLFHGDNLSVQLYSCYCSTSASENQLRGKL